MRASRVVVGAAALLVVVFALNCSKKTSVPTAPTPPASPACALSSSSLSFGSVALGDSAERSFTVSNTGGGTLAGTATTTSPGYAVVAGSSYSLGPSQQDTVKVRFRPRTTGPQAGTIALSGGGCGSVSCTGSGVPSGPVCQLSTTSLDFGSLPPGVCSQSSRQFTISNVGTGTLSGTVTSLCSAFQIVGHTTYNLGPGQRDTITVVYAPDYFGNYLCRVVTGCDTVYCTGTTEGVHRCASLSRQTLDYGTAYVGQTVTRSFTLTSLSDVPFDLRWATDGCSDFFGLFPSNYVQQGDSFTFLIGFRPTREGVQTCRMQGLCQTLSSDGQYHPFGCVIATGNAIVAPGTPQCQLSTTTLSFGVVPIGSSVDLPLTVTNSGGGVLNGSVAPSGCDVYSVLEDPTVSLGPGQSATYTIRFTPTQSGHAITCYVFPFDPNCQVVTLTGEGR